MQRGRADVTPPGAHTARTRAGSARGAASLWLAAALAFIAVGTPAGAQVPPDQKGTTEVRRFEDWALRCRPAAESRPRTCYMVQNIVTTEGGRRVLQVVVGRFGAERVLGALVSVPIGVRLPPGIGLQVDDRTAQSFALERCSPGSCQAQVRLDGELLRSFKAGLVGRVTFQDGAGRPMTVSFSLKGFSAALKELP